MQDKDMINDVLSSVNSSIKGYASVITESSNDGFRKTIQQIRDSDESLQYNLFKMAEQKGFYQPAQTASQSDLMQIKSQFAS
jgi:spore coat protein CotF